MNEKKTNRSLRFWLTAAVIGGVYAALTIAAAPISYGWLQVRISEALTVLPYFTPAAIPGLFIGCFISNMVISPFSVDFVVGSLATLLAALLSYWIRKRMWLVPLPPVLINAVAIGAMIWILSGPHTTLTLLMYMGSIGAGQALSCYALGMPLMLYLKRHRGIFGIGSPPGGDNMKQ
ncbi:MAG: QueT transporter family protein [Clostridiales Family XIII bacterium]|nr:QueT transporter family protein [Clostridiales Family XIII bacterium]